jgi:hypothetical protein
MTSDKGYVADKNLKWIYPDQEAPPRGIKLALLTIGNIQTTGFWDDKGCKAWQRLFTRDKEHEKELYGYEPRH